MILSLPQLNIRNILPTIDLLRHLLYTSKMCPETKKYLSQIILTRRPPTLSRPKYEKAIHSFAIQARAFVEIRMEERKEKQSSYVRNSRVRRHERKRPSSPHSTYYTVGGCISGRLYSLDPALFGPLAELPTPPSAASITIIVLRCFAAVFVSLFATAADSDALRDQFN